MKIRNLFLAALAIGAVSCKAEMKNENFIGKSDIVIEEGKMTPEVLLALGRLSDPQVSPDGKYILYGVSYTSVEENKAVRNLYVCGIDGSDPELVTKDTKSISNARWSADGKSIFFLQGGKIYTAKLSEKGGVWKLGRRTLLSDVKAGISEFTLSPDNAQILYTSSVKSHVDTPKDVYSDLQKASAYSTEDLMYRHWDHWVETIPHSFISRLETEGGFKVTEETSLDILGPDGALFELPAEPFSGIEQLCWSPCGRFIAYSCRKAVGRTYAFTTNADIYIYDILTGETIAVTEGGGYDTDPVWSPDGKYLAWVSMERDGYEADRCRLMVAEIINPVEEDGQTIPYAGEIKEITANFKYNVASPAWFGGEIWFNSLVDGVQGIFKAGPEPDWTICRITAADDWHDYSTPCFVAENNIIAISQSMNRPSELVSIDNAGKATFVTHENDQIFAQMTDPKMEERWIRTVDGKDMHTWVIYPPQFDESKTYPSILICLGGPQGTNSQSWSYRWCYRLMAEQGYVVVLPNRRGTTAFGQEWCEQISGDYSGLNIQDYLSAAREMKKEPFIGKMAACGASYGGYSIYYLAGVHEDMFDCFIAHAGIFNEEHMYYTTEEMWFPEFDNGGLGRGYLSGSPWSNFPEAKRHYANSPHMNVQKWHTPILCIHGGMDFRVPVDEGMAAFNCARMMGVESKLIVFPEENHWILQPQNALFWHREYFDWLDRWCK